MEIQETNPKVSVCVVTYNQEKYIRQCLQSIVDQETDFDFEVIVGDDCSTDGTRAIVQEFANIYPFVIPVLREKNIGAYKNFNDMHNRANGMYVCHVDGDDYWLPGKIKYQASVLDDNPEIVQCWTCAYLVDGEQNFKGIFPSRVSRIIYPTIIKTEDIVLSYALVGQHSTQMYRRNVRKRELLVENTLDYWIAFTNSLSGTGFYSKKIFSAYRIGFAQDSITRTKRNKKVTVDYLAEHLDRIIELYPIYAEYALANLFARRFASYIKRHDLSVIDSVMKKHTDKKINYFYAAKSFWFFMLQKI